MPKPFQVRTVRVNQIGPYEYDFILVKGKVDAHLRREGRQWVCDLFVGNKHYESQVLDMDKSAPPMEWPLTNLFNWK